MADISDPRDKPERYRHLFYDGYPSVFVNKLDVRNQDELNRIEAEALDMAYARLLKGESDIKGYLTATYLLELHRAIFGHIYEWSGRPRGLPSSHGSPPQFIEQNLVALESKLFAKYPLDELQSDRTFTSAAAEIHGEFIAVHPFWDGNHRTARLAIDHLAHATGRPILKYDLTPARKQQYLRASDVAFHTLDYTALANVLSEALERGRQAIAPTQQHQEPVTTFTTADDPTKPDGEGPGKKDVTRHTSKAMTDKQKDAMTNGIAERLGIQNKRTQQQV